MRLQKIILLLIIMIVLAQAVSAAKGHATLLAASDPYDGGVTADLYLETRPGTGNVFIDSSPLTKIDTQISTRFANEVACNYVGKDCNDLDFFYTLKARATIIGGPSAGAAMAALTVAMLENEELNQSIAITGTINSGNIIGPVGGVTEKIEAASKAGITKVLIPKGEKSVFSRNVSVDAVEYGRSLGVDVIEVFSLDEVMTEFTGKNFLPEETDIQVNPKYEEVMNELAQSICDRTAKFEQNVQKYRNNESLAEVIKIGEDLSNQGSKAEKEGSNYAAASFCFGANVRYQYVNLTTRNPSLVEIFERLDLLDRQTTKFEDRLSNATTLSDAQIQAIVKDRVEETRQHTNTSQRALLINNTEAARFELAFAIERLESAISWSKFFGAISGVTITPDMLKKACTNKLAEAQERIEYTSILLRDANEGIRSRADDAQKYLDDGNYIQCLHTATIAKSDADTLLSVYGVRDEEIIPIIERKIDAARMSIARQAEKSLFPVVGYSYYEYANSLKDTDKYSALLFSEYALEFSNLDIYFEGNTTRTENQTPDETKVITEPNLGYLIIIVATAIMAGFLLGRTTKKKRILLRRRN